MNTAPAAPAAPAPRPAGMPQPKPRGTGPGQCPFFNCPGCAQPRPLLGSKLRHLLGLRRRVCSQCTNKGRKQ